MSAYHNANILTDLIPFVPQLKELFFYWATLDDYNRNQLKFLVEQNQNTQIKPMVIALEKWDCLQNYGAPGVEMESVIYDNNGLHEVVKSSTVLIEIIHNLIRIKNDQTKICV
ncbi:Hypothetical protein CINCED_3A021297 [Cinara cedri]|uniref:Uncharacterized protein n=1 Tax=Cinara cedri TaxID=506608 RepID=A0A5E4N423_9HEMI|nr:Hypothetical protein CINCED_3A021297 [Cinara cedri]